MTKCFLKFFWRKFWRFWVMCWFSRFFALKVFSKFFSGNRKHGVYGGFWAFFCSGCPSLGFPLEFRYISVLPAMILPLFFDHSSIAERRMNGERSRTERRTNGARTEVERSSNGGWTEVERRLNGGWTELERSSNGGVDSLSQVDMIAALVCGEVFFWVTATNFSRDTLDDVNGSNFCHDSSVFLG